ncbi:MAG: HTH domain-containing protein [Candidatus Odinarchaeia archaeon]
MNENEAGVRRLILQLSGIFYEVKNEYLNEYLNRVDNILSYKLTTIKTLETSTQQTLIKKLVETSNTTFEELNSRLLKESIKIISRNLEQIMNKHESEIRLLKNRINEIEESTVKMLNQKNKEIKKILIKQPKFKILDTIEQNKYSNLKSIKDKIGVSETTIRRHISLLSKEGYITLKKTRKGLRIAYKYSPWSTYQNVKYQKSILDGSTKKYIEN